jgi:hypothetical protein
VDATTEPPRIVFEGGSSCAEPGRVEALLDATLAAARAPGPGWRVAMRIEPPAARGLRARGEIVNDRGARVAQRSLSGAGHDCEGLARAVGLWASLVLDEQVARSVRNPANSEAGAGTAVEGSEDAHSGASSGAEPAPVGVDHSFAAGPPPLPATDDPSKDEAPATNPGAVNAQTRPSSTDAARRLDASAGFEVGLGTFLMTGTGGNPILGGTPYAVVEARPGFFVRPALAIGESLASLGDAGNNALFVAVRIDACGRVPGNYAQNRGIELTLCGGADVGTMYFPSAPAGSSGVGSPDRATLLPQASIGPSLDLRGDLVSRWALILRGVSGVNVIRNGFTDKVGNRITPDWVSGRIELALAWRMR